MRGVGVVGRTTSSLSNGTASAISTGCGQTRTRTPSVRSADMTSAWKSATGRGASAMRRTAPALVSSDSTWSTKSNRASTACRPAPRAYGMSDVVSPRAHT